MSKSIAKALGPKLRFPEFRDDSEWEEKILSELGKTVSGLSGKSGADFGSGKPFVTYKQVFDNAWIDFEKCRQVQIADNENQNKLQRGDILFTTSSETPDDVGFASVILTSPPEPLYLNSFCFSFRPDNLKFLSPRFSRYLFHSPIYRKLIRVLAQGITRYNISKSSFLKLKIPIPNSEKEQQKIADCLSSIDDLITAQAKKLDSLKAHKKGLMQQLFPAEGETVPKLRFPEFRDAGEWEEKRLGEVAVLITEKAGAKIYTLMSITAGVGLVTQIEKFGKEIAGQSYKNYYVIKKGDFAYNKSSTKQHPEGQIAVLETIEQGAVPNSIFICFRIDKKCISPYFLKYPFANNIHGKWLHKFIAVGARAHGALNVDIKDLLTLPIVFPPHKEQQKIADCLSSIDVLITAQAQKLDSLKTHKKGLMQQLFPTTGDMNE